MSAVLAVFRRPRRPVGSSDVVDEVYVYDLGNGFCEARRAGGGQVSPKLDFMSLADTLSLCGYVRQDAP